MPVSKIDLTKFRRELGAARRLLIVDLGFLGDTIHTLPALWELKQALPNADIHVLTTPVGCEVLKLAPYVDEAIPFPLKAPSPPWWKHSDILFALRRRRYELALSFAGSDRNVIMTALSGARIKAVHDEGRAHVWRKWLIRNWIPPRNRSVSVLEQRRQVIECLGFDLHSATFDLRLNDDDRSWARANIPANVLHCSINASSHVKEWPLMHWVNLGKQLLIDLPSHSLVVTASASERERDRLRQFTAAFEPTLRSRIVSFEASLSIPRLAAVIKRCLLHVGADSGVLHLAVALGVPTVSIFRDYEGLREWQPQGPRHLSAVRSCNCEATKCWGQECDTVAQCLAGISAGEVRRLVHKLVALNPV